MSDAIRDADRERSGKHKDMGDGVRDAPVTPPNPHVESEALRVAAEYTALGFRFNGILGPEIEAERIRQDNQHGGASHDDTHSPYDWIAFIRKFVRKADQAMFLNADKNDYESNLIKVAALAIAAVQSNRRIQD